MSFTKYVDKRVDKWVLRQMFYNGFTSVNKWVTKWVYMLRNKWVNKLNLKWVY